MGPTSWVVSVKVRPQPTASSLFLSSPYSSITLWKHTHPKWHFLIKSQRSLLTTKIHPSLFSHCLTPTLRTRWRLEVHEHGYSSTMDSPKRKARRVLYGSLLRMWRKKDREVPVIRIFCCLGSNGGCRIYRGRGDRRRRRRSPWWRSWCRFSGFDDLLPLVWWNLNLAKVWVFCWWFYNFLVVEICYLCYSGLICEISFLEKKKK